MATGLGLGSAGIGVAALGELEALGVAGTLGLGAGIGFVIGIIAAGKYFWDHHSITTRLLDDESINLSV